MLRSDIIPKSKLELVFLMRVLEHDEICIYCVVESDDFKFVE